MNLFRHPIEEVKLFFNKIPEKYILSIRKISGWPGLDLFCIPDQLQSFVFATELFWPAGNPGLNKISAVYFLE
jgi:hypothetical protein